MTMLRLAVLLASVGGLIRHANAVDHHHHVFVFRHCTRSTAEVNLYDADTEANSAFPTDLGAYLNESLPNWNTGATGAELCTRGGYEVMRSIGWNLMQTLFRNVSFLEVQFVTDVPQRDVTSSEALAEGLTLGMEANQAIHGIENLQHDPILFHPTYHAARLCEKPNADQLNADIQTRISSVPRPPGTVHDAINFIQSEAGAGRVGPLVRAWQAHMGNQSSLTELNPALHALMGPINIVKMVAEVAFYSKASDYADFMPDGSFMPNWTLNQTMGLVAWHYWVRSVLFVANIEAAMKGTVLMHRVLQELQHEDYVDEARTQHEHHATFFIGHDSDLDAIATALDLSWELPLPYPSSKRDSNATENAWFATPPGSALHFVHSSQDNTSTRIVKVGMMTPILLENNGTAVVANVLDGLVPVPVTFHSNHGLTSLEDQTTVTKLQDSTEISGIDPVGALRDRVVNIATDIYTQAFGCYEAALRHYPDATPTPQPASAQSSAPTESATIAPQPIPSSNPTPKPFSTAVLETEAPATPVGIVVAVVMAILVFMFRKPIGRALGLGGGRRVSYMGMDTQHEVEII